MLKVIITTILLSLTTLAADFRPGDLVLINLNCYSCQVIADETGSLYSHSGLVIEVTDNKITLVESLSKVSTIDLKTFISRRKKNSKINRLLSFHS